MPKPSTLLILAAFWRSRARGEGGGGSGGEREKGGETTLNESLLEIKS